MGAQSYELPSSPYRGAVVKATYNVLNDKVNVPSSPLSRLWSEAPYYPRCSDNKTAALVRPREYAIRYPYMQVNRPGMVSWLVFDLDHDNPFIWEDKQLPPPNIIVRNRKTNSAHLYYAISPVCTTEAARAAPIAYMKAISEAFTAELEADQAYSGPVAKTPGHPWWCTSEMHGHEYSMDELADYVDLPSRNRWGKGPDLDSVSHSRHCYLFEKLRFYAYSIVNKERDNGSYSHFFRLVDAYAHNHNNFSSRGFSVDLSLSQVKATVRSVARWTWNNYTGNSRCHRGVMDLSPSLSLSDRQRQSAKRTHKARRQATESKIRVACKRLISKGNALTQVALSELTGLSRQTISTYRHILKEVQTQLSSVTRLVNLTSIFRPIHDVKYGVHQIPAPCKGAYINKALCCCTTTCQCISVRLGSDPPIQKT